jgi:S-adenosylmethionine decarboxylase
MIGEHLIVDAVMEHPIGRHEVEDLLRKLPPMIDMNILAGPFVVEGVPENPGWTGFVIIDKSHISIHTFDDGNLVSIDVFSCKPFNAEQALSYIRCRISLTRLNSRTLTRTESC